MKISFRFVTFVFLILIPLMLGGVSDSLAQTANGEKTSMTNLFCGIDNVLSGERGKTVAIIIASFLGIVVLLGKLGWKMVIFMAVLGGLIFGAKNLEPVITNNGALCGNIVVVPEDAESVEKSAPLGSSVPSAAPAQSATPSTSTELQRSPNKCQPIPPEYSDKGYAEWCNSVNKPWLPSWLKDDICLKYYWCSP